MNNDYSKKSDKEIIEMFNSQVRVSAWVHARSLHLAGICREFVNRGFDYLIIGDKNGI